MLNRALRVCLLGQLLLLATAMVDPAAAQDSPHRYALLIGINEYLAPQVIDLKGAVNDVTMLRKILMTRFGFSDSDITLITDEHATRANILAAFEKLAREAGEDDFVYIHFSGHGSQVEDLNGDEDDMLDETILPYDAREDGVPDIIDDEFEGIFAKLVSRNAFIVFDSCHAGTVTRAASAVIPRFTPPDQRLDLYRRFGTKTRQVVSVEQLPHVLMTAAPAGDEALDGPVDGGWYGLFSYALARGLDTLGPSATPLELHAAAKQELIRIQQQLFTQPPEPQLEGPQARMSRPILPEVPAVASSGVTEQSVRPAESSAESRRAYLEFQRLDGNRVLLLDGADLNAQPGSQWGIFESDEQQFEYGTAIAVGIVERLKDRDAILVLQAQSGKIPDDGRAIALASPALPDRIPVRIDATAQRLARLKAAIAQRVPAVQFVDGDEFARFNVIEENGAWRVMDAGGLQTLLTLADADDAAITVQLAELFESSATATALLGLNNAASDIRLHLAVVTSGGMNDASSDATVADDFAPAYRIGRDGEPRSAKNSLMLELKSDRDVYLTVVDVDTKGGVSLLFPNDYQRSGFLPEGFIKAGAVERIPDSLSSGNRAGFYWDYGPPVGRDTVRVFATTDLATADTIRSLAEQARGRRGAAEELRSGLVRSAVRGIRVVADETDVGSPAGIATSSTHTADWTVASLVIEVLQE